MPFISFGDCFGGLDIVPHGDVAEWLKAPHSKCGIRETVSGVRILPSPQKTRSPMREHRATMFLRRWEDSKDGGREADAVLCGVAELGSRALRLYESAGRRKD